MQEFTWSAQYDTLLDELSNHAPDSSSIKKQCVSCGLFWPCAPARARDLLLQIAETLAERRWK